MKLWRIQKKTYEKKNCSGRELLKIIFLGIFCGEKTHNNSLISSLTSEPHASRITTRSKGKVQAASLLGGFVRNDEMEVMDESSFSCFWDW